MFISKSMLSPFLTKATFRPKSRLPQILGSQLLQKKTSRRAPTPQTGNQKAFETARGLERLLQAALPAKRCARLARSCDDAGTRPSCELRS